MKNEKFDKTTKFHLMINHLKNRLRYQFFPFQIASIFRCKLFNTDCKQVSLLVPNATSSI